MSSDQLEETPQKRLNASRLKPITISKKRPFRSLTVAMSRFIRARDQLFEVLEAVGLTTEMIAGLHHLSNFEKPGKGDSEGSK